jgi:effector-binding domain-containing protein
MVQPMVLRIRAKWHLYHTKTLPRMRVLKTILIILAALVGLFIILGLMGAKTFRVERSTTIAAPASAVYANVSSLGAMDKWGPWKEMEHNMTTTMSGSPDGQVGAVSHWKSDESEGEQKLTELVPDQKVRTELHFISPWEATNTGTFDLAPAGDSTKITWGIEGENGFMARVMSVFMNMDNMVGPMFEKGLANLKTITEEEAKKMAANATPTFDIQSGDRPAGTYVGIKSAADLPQDQIGKFYEDNVPKVFEALGKANVKPNGPLCGLYFDWNEEKKTTSMMVCVPVAEGTKVAGLATENLPAGKAYWTVLNGPYDGMMAAHTALGTKIAADNMEHAGAVLEEYIVGQPEKDSTKYVTNIIYTVKAKS